VDQIHGWADQVRNEDIKPNAGEIDLMSDETELALTIPRFQTHEDLFPTSEKRESGGNFDLH